MSTNNRKKLRREHPELWDGPRHCWFSPRARARELDVQLRPANTYYQLTDGTLVQVTHTTRSDDLQPEWADAQYLGQGYFHHKEYADKDGPIWQAPKADIDTTPYYEPSEVRGFMRKPVV